MPDIMTPRTTLILRVPYCWAVIGCGFVTCSTALLQPALASEGSTYISAGEIIMLLIGLVLAGAGFYLRALREEVRELAHFVHDEFPKIRQEWTAWAARISEKVGIEGPE